MDSFETKIAKYLLQSKAIKIEPTTPFTWASGWKSPIYCDNRLTLSFPEIRNLIKSAFVNEIRRRYPNAEYIAGVATGAIAQGALVADELGLPFIYVRSSAKKHGMENLIEGKIDPDKRIVVIEDLVSTGGSSLKAVTALRNAEFNVLGMVAIFSYGFDIAKENFQNNKCELHTLTNYETVTKLAVESKYIKESEIKILENWRKDPETWSN
jgi:orotate phosphoribosyltransferase